MSRDLADLTPGFRYLVELAVDGAAARGVEMRVFFTLRDPWEQARLWRQSRSTGTIHAKAREMADAGAPWLAQILLDVGPQHGRRVTGAAPGLSWHQWADAVDAAWVLADGSFEWEATAVHGGVQGYRVWAEECACAGIYNLGPVMGDWCHAQLRRNEVLDVCDWPAIDAAMKERFDA